MVFDGLVANRTRLFDAYPQSFFAPLGINLKARVIRLPQRSRVDFLAVLSLCDIALDTSGFSGGNTSLDALSVGLPVVTLAGEFMRGRQTFAMLRALPASVRETLIASDVESYLDIAQRLLADAEKRGTLRREISAHAAVHFNDSRPVVALREWLLQHVKLSV